jgi:RimJ/RimL family protein N-acetyltransferase
VSAVDLRPLGRGDAEAYREIRLEALSRHPDAFGAAFEDERERTVEQFAERLGQPPPATVFGGFDGDRLVGTAGFYAHTGLKVRHGGVLWGMYVRPAWRGSGLAERLVRAVIGHARAQEIEVLELTVARDNPAAFTLYDRLGFAPYGVREEALKVDGRYVAEVLMVLRL